MNDTRINIKLNKKSWSRCKSEKSKFKNTRIESDHTTALISRKRLETKNSVTLTEMMMMMMMMMMMIKIIIMMIIIIIIIIIIITITINLEMHFAKP